VNVRGIGQDLRSFFRLMGGWRFSIDLTLGEVQLTIRSSSVV
jgi:hypothetical protein